MVRTLHTLILIIGYLVFRFPQLIFNAFLLTEREQQQRAHHYASALSKKILEALSITYETKGLHKIPSSGSVVLMCNHQHPMDYLLLCAAIPLVKGFLFHRPLKQLRFFRLWLTQMSCIGLQKMVPSKRILKAIHYVSSGGHLVVFPEEKPSYHPNMSYFRPENFKIAQYPFVPIVPVAIQYSCPASSPNFFSFPPCHITITVLEAILPEEHVQMDRVDVSEMTEIQIRTALAEEVPFL